jgi:hypothetical protein
MQRSWLVWWLTAAGCVVNHPLEVCNGIDDDRDPATRDGVDDVELGAPCDGPDSDLCAEGSVICADGQLVCNDATPDTLEQCNGEDDDCDGLVDEGFELASDPANCGACGRTCTNANGPTGCVASTCVASCAPGAVDCNGDPDDGCEVFRDRNPSCGDAAVAGTISGDLGGSFVLTGTDEAIVELVLTEDSVGDTPVTGMVELEVPAGLDYDLYVHCGDCDGAIMGSSRNPAGTPERVPFRHRDTPNINDDQTIFVEVRFVSETTCAAAWQLRVTGAAPVAATTCGPV